MEKSMFVDTHCHLTILGQDKVVGTNVSQELREQEISKISGVVDAAKGAFVGPIITIATTLQDSKNVIRVAKKFDNVFATVGIHPCDCKESWSNEFKTIEKLLEKKEENKIVALGETGLDFYHKPFFKQRQVDAFKAHIEASIKNELPLVIHIRESVDEVLKVLEEYKNEAHGIAHCFFQKKDIADVLIDWGFYLGVGGPISYPKNDWLRDIIKEISLDHIVLETDAPFLPPQQYRGKTNYPHYIPLIAEKIAEIKNVSVAQIAKITTANAKKVFKIA